MMGARRGDVRAGLGAARRAVLACTLVPMLLACGGGDAPDADSPGGQPEAPATADAEASPDGGQLAQDDEDEGPVPADVTEENGMATLRPPSEVSPDCEGIDEVAPGATLAFPTDDAGMLDAGPGPVKVEFVGCSNTFEANLVYDAFHGDDRNPTLTANTMGGSMGEWDRFTFEEVFWTPGEWTVVVYEDDAATGERQEYDQVTFTID